MNDPDNNLDDVPVDPKESTLKPSTPWNNSWEETVMDPFNLILIGSILWVVGVVFSRMSPFNMSYEAPAAVILSIPGVAITFLGFTLIGTGGSVLWNLMKTDEEGKLLYDGRFEISLSPTPVLSLASGVGTMLFIAITLILTMTTTGPLYHNAFDLVGGVIALSVFLVSYVVDISPN